MLNDQLAFCFHSGVSGQISALMLKPSFLSKAAELTCADPEFERLLLITRGSDAMVCVVTVQSMDLLYRTHGTRH